jgi:SAM-dependent methyltransferase
MAFTFGFKFEEDAGRADTPREPTLHLAQQSRSAVPSPCSIPAELIPWGGFELSLATSKELRGPVEEPIRAVDIGFGLKKVLVDADSVTGVHRDVIAGTYEGGAKVWECTRDLLSYITSDDGVAIVREARVLDMGCGAGLLGCAALQHGAKSVVFQDLNGEVIRDITQPTIFANLGATAQCKFLSGSWESIHGWIIDEAHGGASPMVPVDVVLASEVLYEERYYASIMQLLCTILKTNGRGLIATKRFYYGVGGGVAAFTAFIAASYPSFSVTVVKSFEDRVSMIRDILLVTKNS